MSEQGERILLANAYVRVVISYRRRYTLPTVMHYYLSVSQFVKN